MSFFCKEQLPGNIKSFLISGQSCGSQGLGHTDCMLLMGRPPQLIQQKSNRMQGEIREMIIISYSMKSDLNTVFAIITILMIIIFSSIHISNHVYKYKFIITFVEWGQQSNKFIYLNWLGGILEGDNLKLPFPGLSICWSVVLKVLSYCVIIYRS